MQKWIELELAQQPEIGFRKAVVHMVVQPRSPFDPRARRKPRTEAVLTALLFAAVAICFFYFNFAW